MMIFISYAQNYEDVMLWRALKHIEKGFYIDVGAYSPSLDSVTKAFYNAGWRGINIEPNPVFIDKYNDQRKEDINLSVAISNESGEAEMFFVSNPGLSSLSQEIAQGHSKLGWDTTSCTVKVKTLADICNEYCLERDIHFLKVDIEGLEEKALRGNDWSKFRPWIIVVEATLPMSQVENYKDWEPALLDENYVFAYADGLNRFYVSKEHKELLPAFKYPPNFFDEYRLIKEVEAEAKAEQAEAKAEQAEVNFIAIQNSLSWKLTAPLRKVSNTVTNVRKYLKQQILINMKLSRWIPHARLYVLRRPRLLRIVLTVLAKLPALKRQLNQAMTITEKQPIVATELGELTPRARRIYTVLKDAIEKNSRDK